jgi:hypothetical protein
LKGNLDAHVYSVLINATVRIDPTINFGPNAVHILKEFSRTQTDISGFASKIIFITPEVSESLEKLIKHLNYR